MSLLQHTVFSLLWCHCDIIACRIWFIAPSMPFHMNITLMIYSKSIYFDRFLGMRFSQWTLAFGAKNEGEGNLGTYVKFWRWSIKIVGNIKFLQLIFHTWCDLDLIVFLFFFYQNDISSRKRYLDKNANKHILKKNQIHTPTLREEKKESMKSWYILNWNSKHNLCPTRLFIQHKLP